MSLGINFYDFQVGGREVHLEKLPELSKAAQKTVEELSFSPPQLSWELEAYNERVESLSHTLSKKEHLGLIALGVFLVACGVGLIALAGPCSIGGASIFIGTGLLFVGISLYEMTEWGLNHRISKGNKLKEEAEQYLHRFFEFYKEQGQSLEARLDREIAAVGDRERRIPEEIQQKLVDLTKLSALYRAKEEVKIYREMAGTSMYPQVPKYLGRAS